MSLPIRPSPGPQPASPDQKPLLSTTPDITRKKASRKNPTKSRLKTEKKGPNMSQPPLNSSPLSSPPDSPIASRSPAGLPFLAPLPSPQYENDLSAQREKDSPSAPRKSTSDPAPASALSITSNKSPKRAYPADDEDAEQQPSPHKKPASKSRGKAKLVRTTEQAEKISSKTKPVSKKSAPRKPPTPSPSLSTRPTRTRKPPEKFEDIEEKPTPRATPAKKGTSKVFDPVFITTNSTSRLVKADVYHMLLEPSAWTSLSPEQQSTLISMLPPDATNQALLDKIKAGDTSHNTRPQAFTMSNDCFRTDVAKFKEDLKNGHLSKTWQAAAEQAVIDRAAGAFDKWKAEEAELWWGQKGKTD